MNYQQEYNDLMVQMRHHAKLYYDSDSPTISDYEYDMMKQRIKQLEAEHPDIIALDSPTQKVGGKAKFNPVKHRNKMLSLDDVFQFDEIEKWVNECIQKCGDPTFIVETKIDGLSMSIRYKKGRLILAETRGDGINEGEDVTENAKMIDDIPKIIHTDIPYLEIRGEVYMDKYDLERYNSEQEVEKRQFANTRNAAAGTLRQTDPEVVRDRRLNFFAFNLQECIGENINSHMQSYAFMKSLHIKHIDKLYICNTYDEICNAIEAIGRLRGSLPYDIDGAVIKLDSFEHRKIMGETTSRPRWAIAYKYPPEEKETTVVDIIEQVGRTGKITPVAIFEPITLCGTMVSRATLHNQENINALGINIGSTILVYKSGDIIPKIKQCVNLPWDKIQEPYHMSDNCPICHSKLYSERKDGDKRCINPMCSARIERSILNFVARHAMDIDGLGPAIVKELCARELIKLPADLYLLKNHIEELYSLLGKATTDKILNEIEKSKSKSVEYLLTGLGIPCVGPCIAKQLAMRYSDMWTIMNQTVAEYKSITGIGANVAKAIHDFFLDIDTLTMIQQLELAGVNMHYIQDDTVTDILAGKTYAITGEFPNWTRAEIVDLIKQNGGEVTNTVSSKLTALIVGSNPGTKLQRAHNARVYTMDLNELIEFIA